MSGLLKRYMGSIAAIMVVCLVWSAAAFAAAPVSSAGRVAEPGPNVNITPSGDIHQAEVGARLGGFTRITDKGLVLNQSGALLAGLSKTDIQSVADLYEKLNKELSTQGFDWHKLALEKAKTDVQRLSDGDIRPDATTKGNFWSWRVIFTERETGLLTKALVLGATVAGVAAVLTALPGITLPASVLFVLAGALLGLGAAYIDLVDALGNNKGVYMKGATVSVLYFWHN